MATGEISTNTVNYTVAPAPNVCPGCGRCKTCGQPTSEPYKFYPMPYYTQPFWSIYPTTTTYTIS